EPGRKRQDAGPAMAPAEMRHGAGEAPEQRDQRRQCGNGKGHGSEEPATIDEKGRAQPMEGDEEITPAKGKADAEGRPEDEAPAPSAFGPVQRPDPDGHDEEQDRQEEKGRYGKARQRACHQKQQEAAPAMAQHGSLGQPGHGRERGESTGMEAKWSHAREASRRWTQRGGNARYAAIAPAGPATGASRQFRSRPGGNTGDPSPMSRP